MEPIITKCGYRCDLCLAYKPNLEKHPENQFGVMIRPWVKDLRSNLAKTETKNGEVNK